jgi:cation:H+ antiporter
LLNNYIILFASFAVILIGSELFTNAIEWAGHGLNIAEAAVGSLLAAVGTALPETFIPAVALVTGHVSHSSAHNAVGIGAIIGAPLMLSTVALFVMGIAGLVYRRRRNRIVLLVSCGDARRDLSFFLPIFFTLVLLGLGHLSLAVRHALAAALLVIYCFYGFIMLRLERAEGVELEHGLYLEFVVGGDPSRPRGLATAGQVLFGVLAILLGAREFVEQIIVLSHHINLNPGVLSLILSPLATELPEKYNSVVWIRQRKDHLALANITGAMVFQSCIPIALGLAFTPWHLDAPELLAGGVGLFSAGLLYFNLDDGELGTPGLMVGGIAYAVFLAGLGFLGAL